VNTYQLLIKHRTMKTATA